MKAIVKTNRELIQNDRTPFLIKKNDVDISIMDFHKIHKDHYLLILGIDNISEDNYRLFINGRYLTVILSESRELNRPVYVHHMNWGIFNTRNYEILKNVDIWLPGDNFYLIRHFSVPEDQVLKVFLGEMHMN
jgi:hypothetical protein